MTPLRRALPPGVLALCLGAGAAAQRPYDCAVQPASEEGRQAMARFQVPDGFEVELYAAEPMLANPVCFAAGDRGEVYVAETFRHHQGVTDIREHMGWLDDDLAARTVADRVAMIRRHEGAGFPAYERAPERIRCLRDRDGDGRADESLVYADRFDRAADGIGAGLLERGGEVYYTCIPSLWKLCDRDGDGRAEDARELSTGYGIHVALLGHDLHGLIVGPDGKLYFSCGDRGFRVEADGRTIEHDQAGAVLRCELDGTGLEVFHTGLRNPQELAFDDLGNLFTGDNNSDGGDRARLVQVVEGADSGWRYSYQWLNEPFVRGPWNDEQLWHPPHAGQAAYVLPPIANLADGPSGFACYPGTGFPPGYEGRFFLADFRGEPGSSGVHAFSLVPRGAGFELGPAEKFLWGVLATDAGFGPDGALYVLDWVSGWNKTGKGRLYRLTSRDARGTKVVADTQVLLAAGMGRRSPAELAALFAHPDRRVRTEAHLELAARGSAALESAVKLLSATAERLPRVHAIWALGIGARRDPSLLPELRARLGDADPEVRAQAARVLGDLRDRESAGELVVRLDDAHPRARMYAAIGLGRIGYAPAVEPLFALLGEVRADDPVLRHAAVMGLVGCATAERLLAAAGDPSPHARMGAVLALRRLAHPGIARFLADADPLVVLEAARAIHDLPIEPALGALADLIGREDLSGSALVRRVVNANFRLGGESGARRLADFAAREEQPAVLRREALELLASWLGPAPRDRVLGAWRPLVPREGGYLPALAAELEPRGLGRAPDEVGRAWIEFVTSCGALDAAPALRGFVADAHRAGATRAAALLALETLGAPGLEAEVERGLAAGDGQLRAAAIECLGRLAPERALPRLGPILARGELAERRAAYRILAGARSAEAEALLAAELEALVEGRLPPELALDLVLAAERAPGARTDALLARHRARAGLDPALGGFADALEGGDAERGRKVFADKAETTCARCHTTGDAAELRVGPDLEGVGGRLARRQLLESICDPNRRIAPGYEAVLLVLEGGGAAAGRIVGEEEGRVRLLGSDGTVREVESAEIVERRADLSPMPGNLAELLSREEMRDLIEYLARL